MHQKSRGKMMATGAAETIPPAAVDGSGFQA
jgi:hypothetical protein